MPKEVLYARRASEEKIRNNQSGAQIRYKKVKIFKESQYR
jgi:hypothetical protein